METDCRSWLPIAVLALTGGPALAELSAADYGADEGASASASGAVGGEAERRRAQALIDAARQAEAEQAAAAERGRAVEAERRRAEQMAREAERPPGARLIETHCLRCHDRTRLEAARHTWLGWTLTVARMRLLNGAILPDADAALVRDHLARVQPASRAGALLEYGLAALAALLPLGWILWRRLRRVTDNARSGHHPRTWIRP